MGRLEGLDSRLLICNGFHGARVERRCDEAAKVYWSPADVLTSTLKAPLWSSGTRTFDLLDLALARKRFERFAFYCLGALLGWFVFLLALVLVRNLSELLDPARILSGRDDPLFFGLIAIVFALGFVTWLLSWTRMKPVVLQVDRHALEFRYRGGRVSTLRWNDPKARLYFRDIRERTVFLTHKFPWLCG